MRTRVARLALGLCLTAIGAAGLHGQRVQNRVQNGDDSAVLEFAHKLEATLTAGDPTLLQQSLDLDAALDRAMQGLEGPAEIRAGFRRGVKGSLDYGVQVTAAMKNGGSYRFLRQRSGADGRAHLLFRMLGENGGVNYHEFALRRGPAGAIRLVDVYVSMTGEWVSQTFRRAWLAVIGGSGGAWPLGHLLQGESDLVKHLPQIQAMQKLTREGLYAQALDAWMRLPLALHSDKSLLVQRVQIAAKLGEKEYGEAVDAFFKYHPNDPALDIMLIDACFNRKQWDAGLAAIRRLSLAVGGDAYLDFLRANFLYSKGEYAVAKQALGEAITREPTLVNPYWTLVKIAIDEKDNAEIARVLTVLEKERGVKLNDLKGEQTYAEFRKSADYKKWLRSR
jgi:hypothetical protein